MKTQYITALVVTFALLSSTVKADTADEVRQVILNNMAHMNQALNQDPMRVSKLGSKEFFSSGGLLNHIDRTSKAIRLIFSKAVASILRSWC